MASSLETNKALAALLTAGIIASGAGVMSRIIYHPTMPEEPAYHIDVAASEEAGADAAAGQEEAAGLSELLASANPDNGAAVAKKCAACHDFAQGGANKIGPALWGVVGRDVATAPDFGYSEALLGVEGSWDFETLNGFLGDPKGWAPGTSMAFNGISKPADRADLLAYLRSLSDDPVPLPEAEAAAPAAAAPEEQAASEGAAPEEAAPEAQPTEESATAETATAETATAETATAETATAETATAETATAETATAETATAETATEGTATEQTATESTEAPAEPEVAAVDTEAPAEAAAAAGGDGIGALLAAADVAAGEKGAKKCATCHSFDAGGPNKIGPGLWNVVGRDIAAADFGYSDALAGIDGAWDYAALDAFLAKPKDWAPGTKMAFVGVKKPEDRADIILYLRSLSDNPAPLP